MPTISLRARAALLITIVAGCAAPPQVTPTRQVLTEGMGTNTDVVRTADVGDRAVVAAAPAATYAALRRAYAFGLSATVALDDPVHRVISTSEMRVPHRLAGAPMSRYVSCGTGPTGVIADNWTVLLRLASQVEPAGTDSAAVTTTVAARAQDPASSTDPIVCQSTGALERLVVELTKQQLAR